MNYLLIAALVAEILSIVLVASSVGGLATLALMLLFFAVGVLMFRYIGFATALFSLSVFHQGSFKSMYQAMYPMRYAFAAGCFMLPGFFSDLVGLLLLIPFGGRVKNQENQQYNPFEKFSFGHQQNSQDGNIIDGEFSEVTPKESNHPKLPKE
ncbi:MAG: FxsA family protein [Neisseriaceae bacterium]|nr:FxsA family protein [Neisseriaceae bacterium]